MHCGVQQCFWSTSLHWRRNHLELYQNRCLLLHEHEAEPVLKPWWGQCRAQELWKAGWNPARCWTRADVRLVAGMGSEGSTACLGFFFPYLFSTNWNSNPHLFSAIQAATVHFRLLLFRVKSYFIQINPPLLVMQGVWSWFTVQLQYFSEYKGV